MTEEPSLAEEQGLTETRARILATAERLFAEQGYAGTSIGDISESAGVNRALIYYYFKDKRDLYRSVIQDGLDALSRILDDLAASVGTARERLSAFARRSYRLFSLRRPMVRIIYREVMGLEERIDLPIGDYVLDNFAKLERIILDGIESGEFRQVDPRLAARSMLGMLNIFILEPFVSGKPFSEKRVVNHTVELFCHGIAR